MIMILGLVVRTVSFEFRENSRRKLFWNLAFGIGSFVATLGQGFALAGVIEGIHVDASGHFIGSTWDWFNWRSVVVALTLIQGYVLIGSCYLIMKTTGSLQETHYKTAKIAAITTLIGAIAITTVTPIFSIFARNRLFDKPFIYVFSAIPILGVILVILLLRSLAKKKEKLPHLFTQF